MRAADTALRGLSAASARFEASAWRTARAGDAAAATDIAAEVVQQVSAKQEFSANLRVLETANAMTKQLLDIKA